MTRIQSVERPSRSPESGIQPSRWQRIGPIVSLLLLAPFISEVLYGAVRISTIFVVIPEVLTWGCGALLIRECVRGWRKPWQSMLMMGLALGIAEEWVIQQTSISPLVVLGQRAYGRVGGVNWVYFLWALGFESVWLSSSPYNSPNCSFPLGVNSCGCTDEASSSSALRSHLAHASPGTGGRNGPGSKSSTCCRTVRLLST
jgi:hypothetical protein